MTVPKQTAPDFNKVKLEEAIFVESSVKNPNKIFDKGLINSFKTEFTLSPSFNIEQKSIRVDLKIHCTGLGENEISTGIEGLFHLEFSFNIEDIEEHIEDISFEKDLKVIKKKVPSRNLMIPLIGTAYSTARGMIIMKVLGTPMEGFSLPIINAQQLIIESQKNERKKTPIKSKKSPEKR
jgi:hypothetical protein